MTITEAVEQVIALAQRDHHPHYALKVAIARLTAVQASLPLCAHRWVRQRNSRAGWLACSVCRAKRRAVRGETRLLPRPSALTTNC